LKVRVGCSQASHARRRHRLSADLRPSDADPPLPDLVAEPAATKAEPWGAFCEWSSCDKETSCRDGL